jgi:acyl dehydratase
MPGDTLKTVWTVDALIEKPKLKGGIAEISAVCRNQRGEVVAESDGKILLASASM